MALQLIGWPCASHMTCARATRLFWMRSSHRWRTRAPSILSTLPAGPVRRCGRWRRGCFRNRLGAWPIMIAFCWRTHSESLPPTSVTATTVEADLNRDFEMVLGGTIDLVTTSALLDLVSEAWLQRFVREAAARSLPVYSALSYDGRTEIVPTDELDEAIIAAVNAHQRGDKGFGPALGPIAAQTAIARFESSGYSVVHGQAEWIAGPRGPELSKSKFSGVGLAPRGSSANCPAATLTDGSYGAPISSPPDVRHSVSVMSIFSPGRSEHAEPTGRNRITSRRRVDGRALAGVRPDRLVRAKVE